MTVLIHNALLLSETLSQPLNHARICWHTYTEGLGPSAVSVTGGTATGSIPDAVLRCETYEYWQPTSGMWSITIDLGVSNDCDYVAIGGHTAATAGSTVKVETDPGLAGSWVTQGEIMPSRNTPIIVLFDETPVRRVRVSGAGGSPRIAVIYAGLVLAMQRMIYGGVTPVTMARVTTKNGRISVGGQLLGQDILRNGVEFSLSWKHLAPAWYRSAFEPFVLQARTRPFFIAWRPASYPQETAYVWATDDIQGSNMGTGPGYMQVSVKMKGVGSGD